MKLDKLFVALIVTGLATMLVPVSADAARNLAFDDKGNEIEESGLKSGSK